MRALAICGCVMLLAATMAAQSFAVYWSSTEQVNPDGSVSVTPTVEVAGYDDSSFTFNCIDSSNIATNRPALMLNGNPWFTHGRIAGGWWIDFAVTGPAVLISPGQQADLSYGASVEAACWYDSPGYPPSFNWWYTLAFQNATGYPCFIGLNCPQPLPTVEWGNPYTGTMTVFSELVAQTVTVDSPPVITGIYPSDWYAGTVQSVTFTGQYFGTNAPTLNFSPSTGISYSLTSYNDTQIVANVTVASGTPNEAVNVTVTNNGYGTGFVGLGQPGTSSSAVQAQVLGLINAPEVTVIAWVNGNAPDLNPLPSGANSALINNLNGGPDSCAIQVTAWTLGSRLNVSSAADVAYANAWLLKNSANPAPPSSISPAAQFSAGNYRLFNDFGNGKGGYNVGVTPDPCNTGLIPGWVAAGQASQYMGASGTSSSGRIYLLAEGRIGRVGQAGSKTLNNRTVPWIWSVIEFDYSGNSTYSDTAMFPTYSVYVNGSLVATYPQSSVASFIANDQTYQRTPAQIQ